VRRLLSALLVFAFAGCATPAPESYTAGTAGTTTAHSTAIGANTVGEACTQQDGAAGQTDIYCGTWPEPSAHVRAGGPVDAGTLMQLASSSPWRTALNDRFVCSDPTAATILGAQPAVVMQCTRRVGGWPYVAFVSAVQGQGWYADGVAAAFPAMERSIAVLSGQTRGSDTAAVSGADALLAQRLAARAVRSGDIGQYDALMAAGTRANLADSPVAAEQAFRAALAVQEKALGVGNPNTAAPMMHLALQLSNQQRYPEADALFDRAGTLVRNAADPAAGARLLHYRGLDALNRGKPDEALALLKRAEDAYTELVPTGAMNAASQAAETPARMANLAVLVPDQSLLTDPVVQSALLGIIECRRNQAIALHMQGNDADSEAMLASAEDLARANGLAQPIVTSRIYRTGAAIEQANGHAARALSDLSRSSVAFIRVLPGSKSVAETALLHARELVRVGRTEAALPYCAEGVSLLRELLAGVDAGTIFPCLDAYAAEAKRQSGQEQALLAEMFLAAQLAQSSITSQQIAEASARLLEGGRDPRAADAIRAQQDTTETLADLYRQLDDAGRPGLGGAAGPSRADLEKQIAEAQTAVADADTALQAASPNYGQLVQRVVSAPDVFAALHPGEALSAITLGDAGGWSFLLHDGRIAVQPIDGGEPRMAKLVQRIRASTDIETATPPAFDTEAAAELYTALFGGFAAPLDGVTTLTVAPTGPLLSIPFGLLLTGAASPDALPTAPWLIRRVTIAHVPAAANFVSLRRLAVTARAPRAWFGFGDFRPVTLAQAERSFPPASCGDTARLLAGLPPLPGAILELDSARKLLGASASDELLGPAFTAAAVRRAPLKEYRVLHFATHAVLPTDLRCQNDAAIVTSAPNGAADASGALLAASTVTAMDLNADTILLSACNTGGPNGAAGESLSGLARSFFYAGARSLLITHWAVNDRMSAYLVALTLAGYQASADGGLEASLAAAQRRVLDEAKGSDASLAHPFYWAPLALIGEGGGAARRTSGL
jgi:CHAT domain-containing protein